MKKILIIGSKGMAGHVIYHYLKENTNFIVIDIARDNFSHVPSYQADVSNFNDIEHVLNTEKPTHVINCIGILNQDAENHPDKAILLNSYFPHFLAQKGNSLGYQLIHISTDCVFNGKTGNYIETSIKDGIGFYAQTKALGEVIYGGNLTLRTSIIGPELKENGIGLFHWFMGQKGIIKGFKRAIWTGITTIELSKVIIEMINQNSSGLYHIVNGAKISKLELLKLSQNIFENKHLENILESDDYEIDKSLINTKLNFNYKVKSYEAMLKEMKNWIDRKKNLYAHYS